jgi:uncharacterized repeat protein (TIGR03837 family)
MPDRWDIFCKVVDNYGDAGVCWRLARQLANEHAQDVTVWLDDLVPIARIAPGVDPGRDAQAEAGVAIRRWVEPFPDVAPADVVVEAFGCSLPDRYVAAMSQKARAPAWFVLEYLSAEPWIDTAHGLPSPHPRLPFVRRFWFPGYTPNSGGLLRGRGLSDARDAFMRDGGAQESLWVSLGVPPPAPDELRVSLFCYPNPALPALFDAWADGEVPVDCLVPQGVAAGALDAWTAGNVPHVDHPFRRGRLAIHAIPFVAQDAYDRLLWVCAVNFVRGEDSFVRAQWAAQPFAWHIYPQAGDAHRCKLDAFVARYTAGLDTDAAAAVRGFFEAWNGVPAAAPIRDAWVEFDAARVRLTTHAMAWATHLLSLPDLAADMVRAAAIEVQ